MRARGALKVKQGRPTQRLRMTPGIDSGITDDRRFKKQMERQMGCMTGFLQLFDRQQTLAGKRLCSAKQHPCSPTADSFSTLEGFDASSTSFVKAAPPSPEVCASSPEKHHMPRQSLPAPLPIFEVRDGVKTSWKLREVPRLSLDSRAVVDGRGKLRPREIRTTPLLFSGDSSDCSDAPEDLDMQRRSPSVVARLMGLEALPVGSIEPQFKRSELRRSASESRASRDLSQLNFQKPFPISSEELFRPRRVDCNEFSPRYKPEPPRGPPVSLHRKSVFDSQEFFPEPKRTGSIFGEIEKRLRMHGIDEPAKNLETLKQILEALHLKGLLHDKPSKLSAVNRLNAIYNHRPRIPSFTDSQFVVMEPPLKPSQRSPGIERFPLKHRSASPRPQTAPEIFPSARTRRDPVRRNLVRPPEPTDSSRSPISSPGRRRPFNVEGQRASQPERRITAAHSPRASPKRPPGSDHCGSRSPRIPRSKVEISPKESFAEDDASIFSDTSILSYPSQFEFEGVNIEEYKTGRSLLKRCDKLLHSIAAITSSTDQVTVTDQQPSPVSVLDSSFLSDESPASSLPKRSIDFKDETADWEDHRMRKATPSTRSVYRNGPEESIGAVLDGDYAYIADIILETDRRGGPAKVFDILELRHHAAGSCKAAALHRRLIFDTVTEIINRKRNVPPWIAFASPSSAAFTCSENSILPEVWEEVRWLREPFATESAMELAGKAITQDMAGTAAIEQEWAAPVVEMSGAILHIERQLFKDLVGDTIRELADLSKRRRRRPAAPAFPCRKLIF